MCLLAFINLKKKNSSQPLWSVLLLTVCFGLVALFGAPLHEHDLDPFHVELDCAPCHLQHSGLSLEISSPELPYFVQATSWVVEAFISFVAYASLVHFSRAPPVFR